MPAAAANLPGNTKCVAWHQPRHSFELVSPNSHLMKVAKAPARWRLPAGGGSSPPSPSMLLQAQEGHRKGELLCTCTVRQMHTTRACPQHSCVCK